MQAQIELLALAEQLFFVDDELVRQGIVALPQRLPRQNFLFLIGKARQALDNRFIHAFIIIFSLQHVK